jgi:hypothetical protein
MAMTYKRFAAAAVHHSLRQSTVEVLYRYGISSEAERHPARVEVAGNRKPHGVDKYCMDSHFINIDWYFDPLIDMNLTRFDNRMVKIPYEDINPVFIQKLEDANLKLILAEAFHSRPGFQCSVHVDGSVADPTLPWDSRCRINWVDIPCVLTQWYNILPEDRNRAVISTTMIGTSFIHYDPVPKTVIQSAYLKGWHLFESGVPHKVFNRSKEHRWCLGFVTCPIEQENGWATMKEISERLCPGSAAGEATLLTSGKM